MEIHSYNLYGSYCLPLSCLHRPACRAIVAHSVWEADTIAYICSCVGKGDVLHAGAFFGDFLPALSKSVDVDALVWAFEPNSENYECGRKTIEMNGLRNVVFRRNALGSVDEDVFIRTSDTLGKRLGGASCVVEDPRLDDVGEWVRCVRIDDVLPRHRRVSVVHLDVEGFEDRVIEGAYETISRWRPVLIIEDPAVCGGDSGRIDELLGGLSYISSGRVDANYVFVSIE